MIRGTGDVTDSRHGDVSHLSSATEKLEKQDKFQLKGNITESEAELLNQGSALSADALHQ